MKIQTLIVLVVATGAVGSAALYLSSQNRATVKSELAANKLFPDQAGNVRNATLVTIKADKGGTTAAAIIGNIKWEGSKPGVYIRKAGEPQSWLADGKIELPGDFTGWVDPQIVNIPRDRVKEGKVTHPEGE